LLLADASSLVQEATGLLGLSFGIQERVNPLFAVEPVCGVQLATGTEGVTIGAGQVVVT